MNGEASGKCNKYVLLARWTTALPVDNEVSGLSGPKRGERSGRATQRLSQETDPKCPGIQAPEQASNTPWGGVGCSDKAHWLVSEKWPRVWTLDRGEASRMDTWTA